MLETQAKAAFQAGVPVLRIHHQPSQEEKFQRRDDFAKIE